MTRFQDVLRPNRGVPVQNQLEAADARLPALAESVGFRMWKPGDQILEHGRRVLVGVATYSPLDMELLDKLSEVSTKAAGSHVVDLFNVGDVHSMGEFDAFVPGIGQVFQTPVAGLWESGRLVEKASGSEARRLVMQWVKNDNDPSSRMLEPLEREGASTPAPRPASATPAAHHESKDAPRKAANLILFCRWCHNATSKLDEVDDFMAAAVSQAVGRIEHLEWFEPPAISPEEFLLYWPCAEPDLLPRGALANEHQLAAVQLSLTHAQEASLTALRSARHRSVLRKGDSCYLVLAGRVREEKLVAIFPKCISKSQALVYDFGIPHERDWRQASDRVAHDIETAVRNLVPLD